MSRIVNKRIGDIAIAVTDEYELDEFQDRTWALVLALWALVFGVTFNRSRSDRTAWWIRLYLGVCCIEIYHEHGLRHVFDGERE